MKINWFWLKTINNNAIKYTYLQRDDVRADDSIVWYMTEQPQSFVECVAQWSSERRGDREGGRRSELSWWCLQDTMWEVMTPRNPTPFPGSGYGQYLQNYIYTWQFSDVTRQPQQQLQPNNYNNEQRDAAKSHDWRFSSVFFSFIDF